MKGTARLITNIKPMAGGVAIAQLQVGDYAYGTAGATDLIGFTHFYRKAGGLVELGTPCKATLSGIIVTSEAEPITPPIDPPPVVTPPAEFPDYYILESPSGKRARYEFTRLL